jgi:flavin-dependent dehydrogenase
MKIAIAGAGMAGSYLFRLLKDEGFETVDVYEVDKKTNCGSRPCAWGFAPSDEFHRLAARFVDVEPLVRYHSDKMVLDGIAMGADLLTVDKPGFLKEMMGDADIRKGAINEDHYDRIIDATGVERAYLGPADGPELIAELIQYRVTTDKDLGTWINTQSIGYEWCFPLGQRTYHLGYGNLRPGAAEYYLLHYLSGSEHKIHCRCKSRLRLSSPYYSTPFTKGTKVVGVGESIGLVAPMGGDGNLYAMQSAELLVEHWEDLEKYGKTILKKYDWMRRERQAIDRLMDGEFPTPADMMTFLRHSREAGFNMGVTNAIRFFTKAIETDRERDKIVMTCGQTPQ